MIGLRSDLAIVHCRDIQELKRIEATGWRKKE
jgi:hypothetical protein